MIKAREESFHKKHGMKVRGADVYRAGKRIFSLSLIFLSVSFNEKEGGGSTKVAFLFYRSRGNRPRDQKKKKKRNKKGRPIRRESEKQLGKNEARLRFLSSKGNAHACENGR